MIVRSRHLLLAVAAAACGDRASGAIESAPPVPSAPVAPPPPPPRPDPVPAPVAMLDPESDPWGPNAPPRPVRSRPAASQRLPEKRLRDAPEPADTSFVVPWNDRPRVRVRMPVGNWRLSRPLLVGGASPPDHVAFNPSWYEANIDLRIDLTCGGVCETRALPANILSSARESFAFAKSVGLVPRWIVKPHAASGVWSWRSDASDKAGNRIEGQVAVVRILPELDAVLRCMGETDRRAHPAWLDRLESLCRQLTYEVLP